MTLIIDNYELTCPVAEEPAEYKTKNDGEY